MNEPLFDPITNSEDAMIANAHIKRYHACTYLRAYIMASLCFRPEFVVSDSSVNLNRAFRTLIDPREGEGYYKLDCVPKADFEKLICDGHIRFAARDTFSGNFSAALRETQSSKKAVDPPSEGYAKRIDEICSDKHVYWYSLKDISQLFTSKVKNGIRDALEKNDGVFPELAALLIQLGRRLADEETVTYNQVKSILLEDYRESDLEYQFVRGILRRSYDNNVPEVLGLDYCAPLRGIKPSRNQDWQFDMSREVPLDCSLLCNVYGFSELPVSHLKYIWGSGEYAEFSRQVDRFRAGAVELEEYAAALNKYLQRINEVIRDAYVIKHGVNRQYEKGKLSSARVVIRQYFRGDDTCVVIPKVLHDAWDIASLRDDFFASMLEKIFFKAAPVLAKEKIIFPEPPEEMDAAIILQDKPETGIHNDPEPKSVLSAR